MNKVYIALGSNSGERKENMQEAVQRLKAVIHSVRWSEIYETEAEEMEPGHNAPFLNAVIEAKTHLNAPELLHELLNTESEMGRKRTDSSLHLSRNIDLDLLLFNEDIISTDELIIPHPRMQERYFVLKPFCDLAVDTLIPGTGKTAGEFLFILDPDFVTGK